MNKINPQKLKGSGGGAEGAGVWAFLLVPTKVIIFPL